MSAEHSPLPWEIAGETWDRLAGTVQAINGGTVQAIWGGTVQAIRGGTVQVIEKHPALRLTLGESAQQYADKLKALKATHV